MLQMQPRNKYVPCAPYVSPHPHIEENKANALEHKANKRSRSIFGNPADGPLSESEPECFADGISPHQEPPSGDEFDTEEPSLVPPKRRLLVNTEASSVPAFPERALMTAKTVKVKKAQMKAEQSKQNAIGKIARQRALDAMKLQPELGDGDLDEAGLVAHFELPHASHHIRELHNDHSTIFCNSCSGWSSRLLLRNLLKPCQGLKDGNRSQLRLLQAGLMPGKGVRLPPRLKKRRNKWWHRKY